MAPENDIDYSLSRVPDEAKQPFWRILFIRIGAICCVSQLMLGAALGYGLTFWDAFLATMLGSVLLQVVSWALGTAAAREGLSTSLLSRWTGFGKVGSALFGGVVAISMVGWFGVLGVKCLGYGGEVYGSPDEAEWVQTVNGARRKFKNPIARSKQSGLVLRDALFAAGLKSVPVETVVVFTGKRVQLALPRSTGHYTEKSFSAYLKSSRFEEDKKIQVEPVAAAFVQG